MDEMNLGSGNTARNETKIKGVLDYKSGKRMWKLGLYNANFRPT